MFVCTATRIYYPDEVADPGSRVARSRRVANDSQRANNFMINSKLAVSNDDGRWLDVVVAINTRGSLEWHKLFRTCYPALVSLLDAVLQGSPLKLDRH